MKIIGSLVAMALIAPVFARSATIMTSDNFAGTTLGQQWQIVNGDGAGTIAVSDGLTITDPFSGAAWALYQVKSATGYQIPAGDFTLQIDLKTLSTAGYGTTNAFEFQIDSNNTIGFYVTQTSPNAQYYGSSKIGGTQTDGTKYTPGGQNVGNSVRLVREGSNISVWRASYQGNDWVEIYTASSFSTAAGTVDISQLGPSGTGDSVLWSNFVAVPEARTASMVIGGCLTLALMMKNRRIGSR